MKRKVTSREYKIMLGVSAFRGGEAALLEAARRFWSSLGQFLSGTVGELRGEFDAISMRRIRFLDTSDSRLRGSGYVFRERTKGGNRKVTLKFRHSDRYFSQDRNMEAEDNADDAETKFEEDIKPESSGAGFVSLYSLSTTQEIGDRNLNRMDGPGRLYPGLPEALGNAYVEDEAIRPWVALQRESLC